MSSQSQKASCSSGNKSKKAPNEDVFFQEKLGLYQKTEIKGYVLVQKVQFLMKTLKKEDQCTSILPQADRPELPSEVDFAKRVFQTKIGFQKI
jgi:hypothetical protein